jgi:hypothetical protein
VVLRCISRPGLDNARQEAKAMHFKVLSQIGEHYNNEEGTEGVRRGALAGLEARLKLAYQESDRAREYVGTQQVASNLPRVGRVKALASRTSTRTWRRRTRK